jgi:hypothetical protein
MRRFLLAHPNTNGASPAPATSDVNAEVHDAVDHDGYSLFQIGLSLSEIPKP